MTGGTGLNISHALSHVIHNNSVRYVALKFFGGKICSLLKVCLLLKVTHRFGCLLYVPGTVLSAVVKWHIFYGNKMILGLKLLVIPFDQIMIYEKYQYPHKHIKIVKVFC